jgi:hypothetical protein
MVVNMYVGVLYVTCGAILSVSLNTVSPGFSLLCV